MGAVGGVTHRILGNRRGIDLNSEAFVDGGVKRREPIDLEVELLRSGDVDCLTNGVEGVDCVEV